MTFTRRVARQIVVIRAARQVKQEIEKEGLDTLKTVADAGRSIVDIYLSDRSPSEKARIRRDLNALLQLGITVEMVLDEVALQVPELAPLMSGRDGYRRSETEKLMAFLKEG